MRLDVALGAGYRKVEFQTFGVDRRERPSLMVEIVQTLRAAWTGEPFDFRRVRTRVLPRPFQPGDPPLSLAGTSVGAAKRAARLDMGWEPLGTLFQDVYLEELKSLGKQPPVPAAPAAAPHPAFVHVARDPDAAWAAIGKHVLHNVNEYAAYATAKDLTPLTAATDPDQLLESGAAKVVTPGECVEMLRGIGPQGRFRLNPLEGGIPPEHAWESLRLFETEVLAELRTEAPEHGRS